MSDKFTPFAVVSTKGNGLSAQTNAGLIKLNQQMQPQQQPQVNLNQTMESTAGMVQLPNGKFVTKEQYQKLQQLLQNR